jgi:hypothetical protein
MKNVAWAVVGEIGILRQLSGSVWLAAYTSLMDRIDSHWERQRALELARAVLESRISILEAVRELFPLAHTDAIGDETDRRLIIGIESETDHLPVGEVRKLWAAEALREKDEEIASAEALWKSKLLDACKRIVEAGIGGWPTQSQPPQ